MARVEQLEQHFAEADQRMRGLPMHNPALKVACIGFQPCAGREIGVLITPWCMNLMLLPRADEVWHEALQGQVLRERLPSGLYEFIYGFAEGVGGYASCSLFSPMAGFDTQARAEETAVEVIKALFDAGNESPTDRQRALREQQVRAAETEEPAPERSGARKETPQLSRRGFLTGGFGGAEKRDSTKQGSSAR